ADQDAGLQHDSDTGDQCAGDRVDCLYSIEKPLEEVVHAHENTCLIEPYAERVPHLSPLELRRLDSSLDVVGAFRALAAEFTDVFWLDAGDAAAQCWSVL